MNNKAKTEQILVRLSPKLKDYLRKESEQLGLSMSSFIVKQIEEKDSAYQQYIIESNKIKEIMKIRMKDIEDIEDKKKQHNKNIK